MPRMAPKPTSPAFFQRLLMLDPSDLAEDNAAPAAPSRFGALQSITLIRGPFGNAVVIHPGTQRNSVADVAVRTSDAQSIPEFPIAYKACRVPRRAPSPERDERLSGH